nr:uncharacterized protein CI109_003796 [Kwoniella shandongensis]KAA5527824.1 hypothetical protein CI109_003796 [Kwoniella shandongensis]
MTQPSDPPPPSRRLFKTNPGTPDPWPQRKAAVGLAISVVCWSFYVIVGRVCTPMLRNRSPSHLGRATGAGILVGYIIIWLVLVWTYLKITLTPPGFAKDVVTQSAEPVATDYIPYQAPHNNAGFDPGPDPSQLAPVANIANGAINHLQSSSTTLAVPPTGKQSVRDWRQVPRPVPHVDPMPRWCRFCQITKPDRTHHCRHCGTCILQFDHHCIWIGQCVGWANHKEFFINFNLWAMIYYFYMMIILIIVATRTPDIDGQIIALIAVSALFGLFTALMLSTHINLIITGKTTVESFKARDQQEQEDRVLQQEYGYLWHNQEKRKVRKRWKEEYGGTAVDARWRHGSSRDMWEQEMGTSPWGWIFPVGRPLGDGVHFKSNPHFGPHGEWLMKKDW